MKRILTTLAALALVGSACGSPAEEAPPPEPAPVTTTSTVVTTTTLAATTTTRATTTTVGATSEADKEAIRNAYEIVFSSETGFEEKAPLIDDPSGLEETVAKYQEVGESMGGVGLDPGQITVDGDSATVIYDLLFAGTVARPDLTGDAVLVDGTWKITRTKFCSIMGFARVGCPSP